MAGNGNVVTGQLIEAQVFDAFARVKGETRTVEGVAYELGVSEDDVHSVVRSRPDLFAQSPLRPNGTMTIVTLRNGTKK